MDEYEPIHQSTVMCSVVMLIKQAICGNSCSYFATRSTTYCPTRGGAHSAVDGQGDSGEGTVFLVFDFLLGVC